LPGRANAFPLAPGPRVAKVVPGTIGKLLQTLDHVRVLGCHVGRFAHVGFQVE
jgi:hypothetical protein